LKRRIDEPVVEGRPELALRDEDREGVTDLIAEMLVVFNADAPIQKAKR